MAGGFGKCSKIRHIVKLRQMLRRWRARASESSSSSRSQRPGVPSDVPAGHVAVCVGSSSRRFVIRAAYLNHPVFRKLLLQAEEEFGFAQSGPLAIPCDESLFEEIIRHLSAGSAAARSANVEDFQKKIASSCHVGVLSSGWHESLPLLRGITEKSSVW